MQQIRAQDPVGQVPPAEHTQGGSHPPNDFVFTKTNPEGLTTQPKPREAGRRPTSPA